MSDFIQDDTRVSKLIEAIEALKQDQFPSSLPNGDDAIGKLSAVLLEFTRVMAQRQRETKKLEQITSHINAGFLLEDTLDIVYDEFHEVIPYDRMSLALLDQGGSSVRTIWVKSDQPRTILKVGYAATMENSSLGTIIETGQPRILNDLPAYLTHKPGSNSTRLIVTEGMKSSLTCPLIASGIPVGFIFFSSMETGTYASSHVEIFQRIAGQLSVILEKSRLVSELSSKQETIEAQNTELRRLNDLKNTFLSIAAHDLRTPIGFIRSATNLLGVDEPKLAGTDRSILVDGIRRQSEQMLALINDLLDLTEIEAGGLNLEYKNVSLERIVQNAVQLQTFRAAPKNIIIQVEPVPGITVRVDPNRMQQVLDNLLSNAIKFSPTGKIVSVVACQVRSGWRVDVRDQGPGVSEGDRQVMFDAFARRSARPTANEHSTGLGLTIAKLIVEAHGGKIGVESQPGEGATFWIEFLNNGSEDE